MSCLFWHLHSATNASRCFFASNSASTSVTKTVAFFIIPPFHPASSAMPITKASRLAAIHTLLISPPAAPYWPY